MSNTSFKFNRTQYDAIKKACKNLLKQTDQMAYGDNSVLEIAATDYKYAVRKAILNQNFPVGYRPLSKAYKEWKAKAFPNLGLPAYWRLSGSVMKNLTVRKLSKGRIASGLMTNQYRRSEPYGGGGKLSKADKKNPYKKYGAGATKATNYATLVNRIRPLFIPVFLERAKATEMKISYHWSSRLKMIWS